jgi:hypothetical protein
MNHSHMTAEKRSLSKKGLFICLPFIALLFGSILFPSCTKERTQAQTPATTPPPLGYTQSNTFYSQNQQQEQVFTVDSPGTGPIIGNMGTKLYPYANIFMFPNGANVTYPFTLKLIEVYPVKDIILSNMPTIAGGKILDSKAEIRARAFKGTTELVLRPGRKFNMETATRTNMLTGMIDFYGFPGSNFTDWTGTVSTLDPTINPDTLSLVTNFTSSYSMNIARMGWVACAKLDNNTATTTSISFTASGNNPQNIDVFLVFQNIPCVMKAYNLTSGQIPIGTQLTMIAIANDANNNLVYDKQSITVAAGMTVTLNPVVTTSANLLSVLSAL